MLLLAYKQQNNQLHVNCPLLSFPCSARYSHRYVTLFAVIQESILIFFILSISKAREIARRTCDRTLERRWWKNSPDMSCSWRSHCSIFPCSRRRFRRKVRCVGHYWRFLLKENWRDKLDQVPSIQCSDRGFYWQLLRSSGNHFYLPTRNCDGSERKWMTTVVYRERTFNHLQWEVEIYNDLLN